MVAEEVKQGVKCRIAKPWVNKRQFLQLVKCDVTGKLQKLNEWIRLVMA